MDIRSAFGWLLLAILAVLTWLLVQPFLAWLLATGILAVALFPVHRRLEPRIGTRISAGLLTILVVFVVVIPLIVGLYVLVTQGPELLETVADAGLLRSVEESLAEATGLDISLQESISDVTDPAVGFVRERLSTVLGEGLHAALGFLLLAFVLYYLLADGRQFVGWLKQVTPLQPSVREELFTSTNEMVWAVLKGHVLIAIIQGLIAGFSLFVTGVPYAGVLTLSMMVLALVPIVGVAPILGSAVLYLLFTDQLLAALFVLVWGLSAVAVIDDYVRAMVIDRGSGMHSAFVIIGILGGTYFLGAIGLFVGPVLVGIFKTTIEVLADAYGVTEHPEV